MQRALWTCCLLLALPGLARADAVLQSATQNLFPVDIAVSSDVRAQVESTTLELTFPDLTSAGDHVLTVPSPRGAYSVGVDLDQGQGYSAVPIQQQAPPPGASASSPAPEVKAWEGNTPLLASLNNLQPGPLKVRVRFIRLLRRHQGQVSFEVGADRCPLRTTSDPPATVSLKVRVRTFRAFQALYTQGAAPKIQKQSSTEALLTLASTPLSGSVRTTITYKEQSSGIAVSFLAHRTPSADPLGGKAGYFLLLVDADSDTTLSPPRTLNLVIDRSGSMQGNKIVQARQAAQAMLDNLRPDDKLNIHSFNDQISSWQGGPVLASASNVAAAQSYISGLLADGSTDLNAAIIAGLGGKTCSSAAPEQRFDAMILLSDGQPTAGVTDPTVIHQSSLTHNCQESRIYTFAVGQGADVSLLEAIARSARGRNFILNDAQAATDLADMVRELFEDIYAVRVTDLKLTVSGIQSHEVLPEKPMDLFDGGQVVVVGRYGAPGTGAATVEGKAGGAPFTKAIPINAPAMEDDNGFIKYVWATEKVGKLLADMARGGDISNLEQQITELGLGYQIQTPYTSFATPPPTSSGGGSSSGGGGSSPGNYSSGSGDYGDYAGDVDLLLLIGLGALLPLVRRRRRR